MTTAIVILSIVLALAIGVGVSLTISLFRIAEERNTVQDERDTAQQAMVTCHQQWRNMRHYLIECYQSRRNVSQEGLEMFFTGRGSNYYDWIEWVITNAPPDDEEW